MRIDEAYGKYDAIVTGYVEAVRRTDDRPVLGVRVTEMFKGDLDPHLTVVENEPGDHPRIRGKPICFSWPEMATVGSILCAPTVSLDIYPVTQHNQIHSQNEEGPITVADKD